MKANRLAILALIASILIFAHAAAVQPAGEEAKGPTAEAALKLLQDGNERFVKETLEKKDIGAKRRTKVAMGQHPFAIVLTCADSRVAPELIFNQGLGDLFVLRVAGNITDPFILGSIEYAVEHLHVPLIVVLGHEKCGAVDGALSKGHFPENLDKLLKQVHVGNDLPPDRAKAMNLAIKNNVLFHAAQMTQRSDVLKKEVEAKHLRVVGGVYELSSGKIEWLEKKTP